MMRVKVLSIFFVTSFLFMQCINDATLEPSNNFTENTSFQKDALPNSEYFKVFRAAGAIVIDGNENDWDDVPKHKMRQYYDLDGPIDNKFDLSSYFKMLWDDDNLYVFIKVLDNTISVNADNDWEKDSFELFIDGDNSKNSPADDNIPHTYPGSYDSNDEQLRFVWQETVQRLPWGYDNSTFEYSYTQTNKGWNLEIKMPFDALTDFPGQAGHVFGVEFHINDNDGDGRQNFLKWHSESDYTYLYPSLFSSAYLFDSIAE